MVWILVILSLLAVLLTVWQSLSREIQRTAFEVANGRIIERANVYKQEWLLRGKPQRSEIDGDWIEFSPHGWPYPHLNDQLDNAVDCPALLAWLYPDVRIVNQPPVVTGTTLSNGYDCVFEYPGGNTLQIQLKNNRFSSQIQSAL